MENMLKLLLLSIICSKILAALYYSDEDEEWDNNGGIFIGMCVFLPEILKECVCENEGIMYCKFDKYCPFCPKTYIPTCKNRKSQEYSPPLCPTT